jgi:hypothetical protein
VRFGSKSRRDPFVGVLLSLALLLLSIAISPRKGAMAGRLSRQPASLGDSPASATELANPASQVWNDSLGDGFPDAIRLESRQNRHNFARWFTFLAEAAYYAPSRQAQEEIQDCAGLIRFAYRNALLPHTAAWRRSAALPFEPGFGDLSRSAYPRWPLARALFRTRPGPLRSDDLDQGAFSEFADAATLLNYNTFFVSKDIRAAAPGDLIFFHQPTQREPFHAMLFVGSSYFQPAGANWVVYHTGDLGGRRGEIREVNVGQLLAHPDPRWRPLAINPYFLGVYRLEILR